MALNGLGELGEAGDHGALRIGQRIDHREMVGPGDFLVTRACARLAPCLRNDAALAQEFARLQAADHGVEDAPRGRGPEQRGDLPGLRIVELQILRHRDVDEGREIEQA